MHARRSRLGERLTLSAAATLALGLASPVEAQEATSDANDTSAPTRLPESSPEREELDGSDGLDDDLESDDLDEDEDDLAIGDTQVIGHALADPDEAPVQALTFDQEELRRQRPISAVDVLRRAPGITARDEEGVGLRPNIGFRGLAPDRSRNVLVLEDGVPIQMMPYDYPELYVAPRMERMRSVEVVRGAAQILYGPRTIGAVVNFVTLDPPDHLRITGEGRYGTDGYFLGSATAGDTVGDVGYLLTFMYNRFDGPRHLGLQVLDTMGRLNLDLGQAGELRVKLHVYDENSASTQLGLTQLQYDNGLIDNYAYNDRFPIRRYAGQVTHTVELGDVQWTTTAYGNVTTRDWWRQDFLRTSAEGAPVDRIVDAFGSTISPSSGAVTADDGSAVYFLSTNTGRTRRYTVGGIESRVTATYDLGAVRGEVIGGVRLHAEGSQDLDIAGDTPTARTGDIRAQQERGVIALAGYVRPTFEFFDRRLEIAPGLRVETMWSSIDVYRRISQAGGVVDGVYQRAVSETLATPQHDGTSLVAWIPGLSGTVRLDDAAIVYGGVHRGFVPPGIRDAITGDARNAQLSPEYSWNWELGLRGQPAGWLRYEATAFFLDYQNQVLSPTESATEEYTNGGATTSYGLEGSAGVDVATALGWGFELPVQLAYTWVQATFGSGWSDSIRGNHLPYIPEHTLSGRVDFAHPIGIEAQVSLNYTSSQFTDPYNTIEPTLDGIAGLIPQRALLDARVSYTYEPWHVTVFVDARNLFDTRYIASRAPAGINPGMTRQIFGGVRVEY